MFMQISYVNYLIIINIFCLRRHADINAKDRNDLTPLHKASQVGNANVVSVLLERHAKTDVLDNTGDESYMPIHWASIYGHVR